MDKKNTYAPLPARESTLLARALGMLVTQACIYGAKHRVTRDALTSVFVEVQQLLQLHGNIEIVLQDGVMLVNGSDEGLDASSRRNLAERMAIQRLGGILFTPQLAENGLQEFIRILSMPPASLAAEGGFKAALEKAAVRGIQSVEVVFKRLGQDAKEPENALPGTYHPGTRQQEAGGGDLDALSSAWELDFKTPFSGTGGSGTGGSGSGGAMGGAGAEGAAPQIHADQLASLLRETALLLEKTTALSGDAQHRQVLALITRIRDELIEATADSERHIDDLADQVDGDSHIIDSLEAAARRRGMGIRLTRAELIRRYAELNQEIIQPLTVSTGVIDMLGTNKGGELSPSQQDMLKLAAESIERVNQLVAHMRRIAGLPESLKPDGEIIGETYRGAKKE